jgi:hypothetical protein
MFGGGSAYQPPPVQPAPEKTDVEQQTAVGKQRKQQIKRRGRQAFVLAGPTGPTEAEEEISAAGRKATLGY